MDAKKTIKKFINPGWIGTVICLVIPGFQVIGIVLLLALLLPNMTRANKNIAKLEQAGLLEKAAAELNSPSAKKFMNDNVICTDNFLFCKKTGYVFTYDEIAWAYKHRYTQRLFLIPISVTDSIYLATKTVKAKQVAAMKKDKQDQIVALIKEIYAHNPSCLIGYSSENQQQYKALSK